MNNNYYCIGSFLFCHKDSLQQHCTRIKVANLDQFVFISYRYIYTNWISCSLIRILCPCNSTFFMLHEENCPHFMLLLMLKINLISATILTIIYPIRHPVMPFVSPQSLLIHTPILPRARRLNTRQILREKGDCKQSKYATENNMGITEELPHFSFLAVSVKNEINCCLFLHVN